jgi:hypothetical protein
MPHNHTNLRAAQINFEDIKIDTTLYKQRYPEGLNLHPDSEQHRKILTFLNQLACASKNYMEPRYADWKEINRQATVYIPADTSEKKLKQADSRKPISMVVPHIYAVREILMTYRVAAFLRDTIFGFEYSGDPDDRLGTILLEMALRQDSIKNRHALALYTQWMDDITYGFGAVCTGWSVGQRVFKTVNGVREDVPGYSGTTLRATDPFNTLPDPVKVIHEVNEMAYFGDIERFSWLSLKNLEAVDENLFNIDYFQKGVGTSALYDAGETISGRYDKSGVTPNSEAYGNYSRPIDVMWMTARIIPAELGMGRSTVPELWKFGVGGDRIIIAAIKQPYDHNQIDYCVDSSSMDGHSTIPISRLEIEHPTQVSMNFLWNSHQTNIRKSINNMLVVDPSLVNINDLMDTKEGMVIRMRKRAFGRGMTDKAISQLRVEDITRGNIADIGFLRNFSDSASGLSDSARGAVDRRGSRVSSFEAQAANRNQLSRQEKDALLLGMQGHYNIAHQLAFNLTQFGEDIRYVKMFGDYQEVLKQEYGFEGGESFRPSSMDISWDVLPKDGTILSADTATAWNELITTSAAHPGLFQRIDFVRAWLHIARLLGVKDANKFLKQEQAIETQVAQPQEVDQQVRAGNIIPLAEVG